VQTLSEAFLEFSAARGRAPTTVREYERIFGRFFLPSLGQLPVPDLTPFDLDTLYTLALQQDRPITPITIRKYHAVISAALSQAVRWGWIPANPARSVSLPTIVTIHKTVPTPGEVASLIRACTNQDKQLGAFVLLAAISGCRRGELAALRWSDVEDDRIVVRRSVYLQDGASHLKATKTGRERIVSVGPRLRLLLREWRKEDARLSRQYGSTFESESFLFSDDPLGRTPVNVNAMSSSFRRAADSIAMEHVTLHTLRHFAASQLLIAGATIRDVADRLGHANAVFTLNTYVHGTSDRQSVVGVLAESVVMGKQGDSPMI
jgi:integrase